MKKGKNKKELLFYIIIIIIGVVCMCLLMANAKRVNKIEQDKQTQQTLKN